MAKSYDLSVKGYIVRGGCNIMRELLPADEQKRLALMWNKAAFKEAGYVPRVNFTVNE